MNAAAFAFAVVASLGCALPALAAVVREGQVVMGTILTLTVVAADRPAAEAMAKDAIDEARRWDDALTIWRPEGELASLNAKAGQGTIAVGARLARGLAAMLEFAKQTEGAFEPAIVANPPGTRPAAFTRGVRQVLSLQLPPAAVEPASGPAFAAINKGSALDPGGIGKGLALDAILSLLRGRGAIAAFADFGGSSQAAIGAPPGDARGWAVIVAGLATGVSHGVVHLRSGSLSTSRAGAPDTTPILDPRSGTAVPAPRMATIRAVDATTADAWSTALVVLGHDGVAAAESRGMDVLLEDQAGTRMTAGWDLTPTDSLP